MRLHVSMSAFVCEGEKDSQRKKEQFVTEEDENHSTVSRLFGKNNIAAIFVAHLFIGGVDEKA